MVPQNYVKLTGAQATQMVRLVEALEEHDDVQHVYANFDIDESEIQAAVGSELINVGGFFAASLHLGLGRFS